MSPVTQKRQAHPPGGQARGPAVLTLDVPGEAVEPHEWRVPAPRVDGREGGAIAVAVPIGGGIVRAGSVDHVLGAGTGLLAPIGTELELLGGRAIAVHRVPCRAVYVHRTSLWRAGEPVAFDLLSHLGTEGLADDALDRAWRLFATLILPQPTTHLPLPTVTDDALRRLGGQIWETPSQDHAIDACAATLGTSPRTLSRRCRTQAGMSFRHWRTRIRLHRSVYDLIAGHPVATVAALVGFRSVGAYSDAFKAAVGVRPGALRTDPT